jgi:hypothetical protein
MRYLQKYSCSQQYGGPEEGGWWYDLEIPLWKRGIPLLLPEEICYKICRYFNGREHKRRDRENKYGYTSVLSYRDEFFSYGFEDSLIPAIPVRPHYE